MKVVRPSVLSLVFLVFVVPLRSQSLKNYRKALPRDVLGGRVAVAQHLHDYVVNGKLTLSLRDAILLALENNSSVRVDETQIENQKMSVLGAYAPFDPMLQSSLNVNRYSTPGYTELQGVGQSSTATVNSLSQFGQISYTQTFSTGTNVQVSTSSNKNSTNSSFLFFNPYYSSSITFQFTQPLLRGAGRFANTAPIIIARRELAESEDSFKAEVSSTIYQVIQQYWAAVQARGNLNVSQQSMKLAQASYDHDRKALSLGALPPLDIYRSESEVAAIRVNIIQAQSNLVQTDDALRLAIGANQDPQISVLPLDLTESPVPQGELKNVDAAAEISEALKDRPEVAMTAEALEADHLSIRLAHNQLRPNLSVQGLYQANGLGGNQYNLETGQLISPGGFGSSFGQVFGFGYPEYGGTLTLQFPLRNHQAEASLGNALVAQSHDRYYSRQIREQIRRDVADAVEQLNEAKLALEAAKSSYGLAQQSLEADQQKYELGAETIFFVLDSQARLAQAESVLLQTEVSYQLALASLNWATGDNLTPWSIRIRDLSH
jgi:outer membrane protein